MTIDPAVPIFCAQCGNNVMAERAFVLGPLAVDPHGDARWDGRRLQLTPGQFHLVNTLAQAAGAVVSSDVLAERVGYDGDGEARAVVQVLACRVRHALRAVGATPMVVQSVRGRGYRLDLALLAELERTAAR